MFRLTLALTLITMSLATTPLAADEGMWLFSNPPRELLKQKYGFDATDAWLDHLRQSAVRFNSGGSGSFVSANGLVMTNHHVGADALAKLSSPERDILNNGYHAKTQADEIKCLDLELNVLVKITDVTDQINSVVTAKMSAPEAEKARRAKLNTLEQEAKEASKLRSDVVTLYQGGQYHLYQYKQYTDVRLVFAPEQKIAFFGGDPDNFEYPRYDLDVCFFRAYENDKPAAVPHHLKWSAAGAKDGELTFVAGHPGKTDRLNTVAHLEYLRDRTFPAQMNLLRRREVLLKTFSERSEEQALQAQDELFGIQNSRKARLGGLGGLQDPAVMAAKRAAETALRKQIAAKPEFAEAEQAFQTIETSFRNFLPHVHEIALLEQGQAFNSALFSIAQDLVRLADERAKPNAERLREYSEAGLESLKQELFSEAPIYDNLEIVKLADSLSYYLEMRGGSGPLTPYQSPDEARLLELMNKVMAGKSPTARAGELIKGTKLRDIAERKKLFDGGKAAIEASTDPMIQLARLVDPAAREVRKKYESTLEEPLRQSYAKIAKARFALQGTNTYPDATFTLRLAFGTVSGFTESDGKAVPPWTTLGGTFDHADKHKNQPPYQLPESWLKAKDKLKLGTPFNFVSTADIIGGNSGSPVVNRAGEIVGIIFDGNIQSLVLDFAYSDTQARAVSVHSAGIIEALNTVYQAEALVRELTK
jgi:hypothetical protein